MADTIDIKVPDLGDFSDVEVIEVLVKAGDRVQPEDGLITLETEKAAMDVPTTDAGEIEAITVGVGDKVSTGDVIGRLKVDKPATDEASPAAEPVDDAGNEAPKAAETESGGAAEPRVERREGPQGGPTRQPLEVPDIGDFTDVEVIEVHVKAGDEVAIDDPLITLETEKAAMDVPSTAAGRIESVDIAVGDRVSEGTRIAVIVAAAGAAAEEAAPRQETAEKPEPPKAAEEPAPRREPERQEPGERRRLPSIDEAGFAQAHASPSVRKLARELGVDLIRVKGSGPKNRVLQEDVKAWVKAFLTGERGAAALPKVPRIDFRKFGEIDLQPLTRIQKISGPRLQASWVNLPHVTQHDLADITELEAKRQELKGAAKERGINLTPLAFVMKAVVAALQEFPKVNASLGDDGETLVMKHYHHLGFAVDTEQGLVVPVIRDADRKDVFEIATELGTLSQAARDGKLKLDQMQGASFTITSLGSIGGTLFTPIVNAPEVAILGVSRSTMQPVWDGSAFVPRLMLPLSLSYDHRVVDGADAVRFTTFLAGKLGDVDALLEAVP